MSYENPWIFQGKPFESEQIGENQSFVYLITNKIDGRKYIGKKGFWSRTTKPPLKGQKRKRRIIKESDWKTYYGSNDELKADIHKLGAENFTRQILILCSTKSEASYWEAKLHFDKNVLTTPGWYNDWIMVRVNRSHLKALQS